MKGFARFSLILALPMVVLCLCGPAAAKPLKFGLGVQPVGLSVNPDQYVFGVQSIMGSVTMFQFAPSVDFGFGDNVGLIMINLHLLYDLFSPPKSGGAFYLGGGPAINLFKPEGGDRDTEVGIDILAGFKIPFHETRNYYNIEARYGIDDVPDFKLLIGVMFAIASHEK